jgi:hypothetical protein
VKVLKKGTTFFIGTSSDSKWILSYKFGKSMSIFDFRKLIKILRKGIKYRYFHGGININLEHFLCWKLLANLHRFLH